MYCNINGKLDASKLITCYVPVAVIGATGLIVLYGTKDNKTRGKRKK